MHPPTFPSTRFRHVIFPAEALHKRLLSVLPARDVELPRPQQVSLSEENALFLQWLFAQAGLELTCYRPETLHRRLPACFRRACVAKAPPGDGSRPGGGGGGAPAGYGAG